MNGNHAKLALFVVQQEIKRLRAAKTAHGLDPLDNPLYAQLVGTAASLRHEVKVAAELEAKEGVS